MDTDDVKCFEIYKATNKLNGKYYIGVTTQGVVKRMKKHLYKALSGSKYKFHEALRQVGIEGFTLEVLAFTEDLEEAKKLEKKWIEFYHATNSDYGYNSDCGGDIMFHTEETKEKIRKIHVGKDMSKFYNSVLQYTKEGKFLCEYASMSLAAIETGICRASIIRSIRKAIKTQSKTNPFIWVYKKDYPEVPLEIDTTPWNTLARTRKVSENFIATRDKLPRMQNSCLSAPKAVIQYDKNGEKLAEFDSISQASKFTGISSNTIVTYCSGKNKEKLKDPKFFKRVKYIWRYKE